MVLDSDMTGSLVKDYISYRLHKAGHESSYKTDAPTQAHRILRQMGEQFESAYFNSFDDMTNTINIHGDDLQQVFYNILDVTFDSGIQWGRIVGAFVFSARLCVKAMDGGRTDVVHRIITWTTDYLERPKFSNWINQKGGWDGFVQFYKNPQRTDVEPTFNWGKACSVGINALSSAASFFNAVMRS